MCFFISLLFLFQLSFFQVPVFSAFFTSWNRIQEVSHNAVPADLDPKHCVKPYHRRAGAGRVGCRVPAGWWESPYHRRARCRGRGTCPAGRTPHPCSWPPARGVHNNKFRYPLTSHSSNKNNFSNAGGKWSEKTIMRIRICPDPNYFSEPYPNLLLKIAS